MFVLGGNNANSLNKMQTNKGKWKQSQASRSVK